MQRPILSSSFSLPRRRFLFARARLFDDRLDLTGWSLTGRYHRAVQLDEITRVEWWSGRDDVNLAVFRKAGNPIELSIRGAGNWKFAIEERLARRDGLRAPLPDDKPHPAERSAAA